MPRIPKRKLAARNLVDRATRYPLEEAVEIIKKYGSEMSKFDETVDLAINLGVDPKQSDQTVRGAVVLPHGTGKTVRVLVFAKGEKEAEAREAGADYIPRSPSQRSWARWESSESTSAGKASCPIQRRERSRWT